MRRNKTGDPALVISTGRRSDCHRGTNGERWRVKFRGGCIAHCAIQIRLCRAFDCNIPIALINRLGHKIMDENSKAPGSLDDVLRDVFP
ncbi:hypothetical protein P691DRAFT_344580 [Macrolepiota fuliginosa MF-IS2]|uniref:Uncharacterized protein n=1 Tax=Macrolepiota fuliginosa MF-IS2 TaxID=1400762 RepID=A0A9P5XHK1_9AGAR|nr:hypothetical protein P691DRAFT_344580 [Macrolepiota fuliginosa MF-IS2]